MLQVTWWFRHGEVEETGQRGFEGYGFGCMCEEGWCVRKVGCGFWFFFSLQWLILLLRFPLLVLCREFLSRERKSCGV